jgi:hypothetical protein
MVLRPLSLHHFFLQVRVAICTAYVFGTEYTFGTDYYIGVECQNENKCHAR